MSDVSLLLHMLPSPTHGATAALQLQRRLEALLQLHVTLAVWKPEVLGGQGGLGRERGSPAAAAAGHNATATGTAEAGAAAATTAASAAIGTGTAVKQGAVRDMVKAAGGEQRGGAASVRHGGLMERAVGGEGRGGARAEDLQLQRDCQIRQAHCYAVGKMCLSADQVRLLLDLMEVHLRLHGRMEREQRLWVEELAGSCGSSSSSSPVKSEETLREWNQSLEAAQGRRGTASAAAAAGGGGGGGKYDASSFVKSEEMLREWERSLAAAQGQNHTGSTAAAAAAAAGGGGAAAGGAAAAAAGGGGGGSSGTCDATLLPSGVIPTSSAAATAYGACAQGAVLQPLLLPCEAAWVSRSYTVGDAAARCLQRNLRKAAMSHTLFCYHVLSLLSVEQVAMGCVAAHPYVLDPWLVGEVVGEVVGRERRLQPS